MKTSLRLLAALLPALLATPLHAVQKLPLEQVLSEQLTQDARLTSHSDNSMTLVWWMPPEFWAASFSKEKDIDAATREEMLKSIRPYSVLVVIRADVSPLGSFHFHDYTTVTRSINASVINAQGKGVPLTLVDKPTAEFQGLLNVMKPMMGAAMGNMGANMHFLVFSDMAGDGSRLASPYLPGRIHVDFTGKTRKSAESYDIETPLNALFVPRLCPNGKPAHVSWTVCPWDGSKLPE